ncbi:MAG: DUF2182 domain-containing protein [Pseudomonadota bacterium]
MRITLAIAALAWMWLWFAPGHFFHWPAMVVAMMLPTLIPQIAHVRARSFAPRKQRAALLFVVPYLAVWIIAGAAMKFLFGPVLGHPAFAPVVCLLAALWEFSPPKRRALNKCHSRPVLTARGPKADWEIVAFALSYARFCLITCLPMMMVMLGTHDLAVMVFVTVIILYQRAAHRPDPRAGALALLLTALVLTLMARTPHHHLLLYKDICNAGL